MDKRPIGYKAGQPYFMDKKPKKNPKYENIKGKLSTGPTKDQVVVISDKNIAKRKSEVFTRISPKGLYELIVFEQPAESIYNMGGEGSNMLNQMDNVSVNTNQTSKTIQTSKTMAYQKMEINEETDFLILDIREPEDFSDYHIKEAINFPAPLITRDRFLPIIMQFKNKDNKWIVMYHTDEKHSMPAATTLFEKGFDNLLMMSGGIEDFHKKYPELIEGNKVPEVPVDNSDLKSEATKKTFRKKAEPNVTQQNLKTASKKTEQQASFPVKKPASKVVSKVNSNANNMMTTNKVVQQQQEKAAQMKKKSQPDFSQPVNAWDEIPDSMSNAGGQVRNKLSAMAQKGEQTKADQPSKEYYALPKKSNAEVTGKVTMSYLPPDQ